MDLKEQGYEVMVQLIVVFFPPYVSVTLIQGFIQNVVEIILLSSTQSQYRIRGLQAF